MINLYGNAGTEAAQGISGRAIGAGTQATAGLRTRSSSRAAFTKALGRQQGNLLDAIEAWGIKNVLNWKENSAQIMQSLQQDLSQMRQKAHQARAQGDMESYKLVMQRILFDKQMAAQANMLNSSNAGSIISAIVGGLGQIAAGYFTSDFPALAGGKRGGPTKPGTIPPATPDVSWRDYYNVGPPGGA